MDTTYTDQILAAIRTLAENPAVQSALLLLVLGLIPRRLLDRLPIFGNLIALVRTYLEAKQAKQEARKVDAGNVIAESLVQGYEQLKKTGKADSASAAAEVAAEIARRTGLTQELSRILVERAVHQQGQPLGQFLVGRATDL